MKIKLDFLHKTALHWAFREGPKDLIVKILEKIDSMDLSEITKDLTYIEYLNLLRISKINNLSKLTNTILLKGKPIAKKALPYVMLSAALGAVIYLKHFNAYQEEEL